jgi:hypothetical protein
MPIPIRISMVMPIQIRIPDLVLDPDSVPDWHQNDANPHADLTPSFT